MRTDAPVDLIAVDAHAGYYLRQTVLERLREDVVAPARAAGYEKARLVGISLGGLGAALYATDHADHLAGLILLLPSSATSLCCERSREPAVSDAGRQATSGMTTISGDSGAGSSVTERRERRCRP
jgi:pimeloyl-ACP methyl ester carboxylesterase